MTLVPNEQIVEVGEFETAEPTLSDEMGNFLGGNLEDSLTAMEIAKWG